MVRGQHDDRHGMRRHDPTGGLQPVQAGHLDVHDHDVRIQRGGSLDGFLAIGSAPTSGDDVNVLLRAPSDASGWEAIDDPGFGRIFDAAAGSSSEIIVTNTKQDLSGTFNVWRSTDGQTWTLDTGWTTDATTAPVLATGGPAGFLILGQTGPSSDVWTSSDGKTWAHGVVGPAIGGAAVVNGGFLAYSVGDRKIYASVNGTAWQAVASPVNALIASSVIT